MTTSTVCRNPDCKKRFEVNARAGRNTYRRRSGKRPPKYPHARYCSDRCRKAASRARLAARTPLRGAVSASSGVTGFFGGTDTLSGVTSPPRPIDIIEEFSTRKTVLGRPKGSPVLWRWYQRLDGSSDLYCDTETSMRHVARIVRRDGQYFCAKPSGMPDAWATCAAAQLAVRSKLKRPA
jgi:hypothetical protein